MIDGRSPPLGPSQGHLTGIAFDNLTSTNREISTISSQPRDLLACLG